MKKCYLFTIMFAMILFVSGLNAQETITIKKQPMGITIDGIGDEKTWENAEEYKVENHLGEAPEDEYDFSSSFKVAWNDTAIFFLVTTNDFDIYPVDNWWADGIEFYFQFGDGEATPTDIFDDRPNGFFQVAFRLTNEPTRVGAYLPDSTRNHAVTIIDEDAGTWVTEGYMAWGQFNDNNEDPIDPVTGYTFKFDVNVGDNDEGESSGATNNYWSSTIHLWTGDFSEAGVATLSDEVLDPDAVVGINSPARQNAYRVYPNPVVGEMNIMGDVDHVSIYSVIGKEVFKRNIFNNVVDVSALDNGLYFVNLYKNGKLMRTQKVVIQ
ncbi:MAG: T9SS type A sorting domain-containing protein [Bacteroidales bacterium]